MNDPKGLTAYVLMCVSFRVELQTTHDLTNTENRKYTVYSKTFRSHSSKNKEMALLVACINNNTVTLNTVDFKNTVVL